LRAELDAALQQLLTPLELGADPNIKLIAFTAAPIRGPSGCEG